MTGRETLVMATSRGATAGVTLSLSGEIDFGNVGLLRTKLSQLIKATAGDITLDLSGVAFLDSTALGVLIQAKKRLVERNDQLVVINPQPRVRRIFEVAGLETYLGV